MVEQVVESSYHPGVFSVETVASMPFSKPILRS